MKFLKKFIRSLLPPEISRDEITIKFLKGGSWARGIDVGARRSYLLEKLSVKEKYTLDYHNSPSPKFTGTSILHNLDLVIANDVIEHVENKQMLVNDIFSKCNSDIIIALPNTQHFLYLRGLFSGKMSKQFVFDVKDGSDRHRWVTYYDTNIRWLNETAQKFGFALEGYENAWRTINALHLLLLLHPRREKYFVANQVFHFKKLDGASSRK